MRALDDILVGFFIFFAIDRAIRLFSNGVVDPWAKHKTADERVVENWKLGAEFALLVIATFVAWKARGFIAKLNKA